MVSEKEIKKMLMKTWPDLRVFVRSDPEYILPILSEVSEAIIKIGEIKPAHGSDCDDYALHLHSKIKWNHPHWAFGECFGEHIRGRNVLHYVNVCVTQDRGVILIEPQIVNDWWIPQDDKILWVRI